MAFLDIAPVAKGHLLLVPKKHVVNVLDANVRILSESLIVAQRLALALQDALGAEGVSLVQSSGRAANQEVMHLHFHLVPRFHGDGLHFLFSRGKYLPGEDAEVAKKLAKRLL